MARVCGNAFVEQCSFRPTGADESSTFDLIMFIGLEIDN